jgi:RHS repeat-associated protein
MRKSRLLCLISILLLPTVVAAQETARLHRYLMVLKDEGRLRRGNAPVALEPDLSRHGGQEIARNGRIRVVLLPEAAIQNMRLERSLYYLSRLYTGAADDRYEFIEGPPDDRPLTADTDSDPTKLDWKSGNYSYDGSGNIAAIGTDSYAYDTAQRLARATVNNATVAYAYDSFGNRLSTTIGNALPVATPADPGSNRLHGAVYDMAGNQLIAPGDTESYAFDAGNMMSERVAGTSRFRYIYTADDERIGSLLGSEHTWTIRDVDGKPLSAFSATGSPVVPQSNWTWMLIEDNFYLNGRTAVNMRYNGSRNPRTVRHYHPDHLGTPRLVTNASGQQLAKHTYYPFGIEATAVNQEWANWGTPVSKLQFTGHERDFIDPHSADVHTYIDYMHARYYVPAWGRFLSVDPTWESADLGKPQSWNRYSYVRNNPINLTDPDGRNPLAPVVVPIYLCAASPACSQRVISIGTGAWQAVKALNGSISMSEAADGAQPDANDLPENPDELLDRGYQETSHPNAAKAGHRTFENPETGDVVRHDKGKEGRPGHEGNDHYHRYNPNRTGQKDQYLDQNGNPVPRGSEPSHLYPKSWWERLRDVLKTE